MPCTERVYLKRAYAINTQQFKLGAFGASLCIDGIREQHERVTVKSQQDVLAWLALTLTPTALLDIMTETAWQTLECSSIVHWDDRDLQLVLLQIIIKERFTLIGFNLEELLGTFCLGFSQ